MAQQDQEMLHLSTSPHIRYTQTVPSIMMYVVLALIPAFVASIYFFGMRALFLTAVCVISCLLTEYAIARYLVKRENTVTDWSALVTGVLLAFNLPPALPWWMAVLGSVFAIGVVKWAFGGLGNNFVNPALAGRAFLLASYPAAMTTWTAPRGGTLNGLYENGVAAASPVTDAITSATPLAAFQNAVREGSFQALDFQDALGNLFMGNVGGCIGETSALALLLGAVFLMYKRVIGLRIPITYLATVFLLFWIFNGTGELLTSDALIIPVYQVLAGGLMLGALYMATDMVTSPITPFGQLLFALGCGILTFVIRRFGGYPEGVSYSILLMNLIVPLLDRYTRPRIYGKVLKRA
ncbi:MAG: RnfABCDGE type electron transport complex subunit D [Chitinivibrionales bacterium]